MTANDRREFLKKLAKSAAYIAPVMVSVAAPAALAAQGQSSQHKKGSSSNLQQDQGTSGAPGGAPPWKAPPPGTPLP